MIAQHSWQLNSGIDMEKDVIVSVCILTVFILCRQLFL